MRKILRSDSTLDRFLEKYFPDDPSQDTLHLPVQIDSLEMQLNKAAELERLLPSLGRTQALDEAMQSLNARDSSLFASYLENMVNERQNKRWEEVVKVMKVIAPLVDENLEEVLCIWDLEILQSIIQKEALHENSKQGDIFALLDDKGEDNEDQQFEKLPDVDDPKRLNFKIDNDEVEVRNQKEIEPKILQRRDVFKETKVEEKQVGVQKTKERESHSIFDLLNSKTEVESVRAIPTKEEERKREYDNISNVVKHEVFERGNILKEAFTISLTEDLQMEKIMDLKINTDIGFDIFTSNQVIGPKGWLQDDQ